MFMASSAYADSQEPDLPDFSLYAGPAKAKVKMVDDANKASKDAPNIPSINDQDLNIKTQEIPQYVLDMLSRGKNKDFNSLANESANKQLQAAKAEQKQKDQQEMEKEKLIKERAEVEALALKKKKEEEDALQRKLLEEQYRVFEHRSQYDPRSIAAADQIHKRSYGPGNQHLPPFIALHQYSQYLFLMTVEQNIPAIKELLHKGADINARDKNNHYTPLMYAVQNNKPRSVDYLLNKGADFNAQDSQGRAALHIAARQGNIGAVNSLLDMKSSVEIQDSKGNRPVVYLKPISDVMALKFSELYVDPNLALLDFSEIGKLAAMQEAISKGADVNIQDAEGRTPLMLAIEHRDPQLIALLLQKNPNMHIANKAGDDALVLAQRSGDEYIWSLIKTRIDKEVMAGAGDVASASVKVISPVVKASKPISLLPKNR